MIAVCGALCKCSFGAAPVSLNVLPTSRVMVGGQPVASCVDFAPMVNIPTFGMCSSLANPTVMTATAAALGVLTPMPCVPAIASPWSTKKMNVVTTTGTVVSEGDMCMCSFGGVVTINMAGQFTVL